MSHPVLLRITSPWWVVVFASSSACAIYGLATGAAFHGPLDHELARLSSAVAFGCACFRICLPIKPENESAATAMLLMAIAARLSHTPDSIWSIAESSPKAVALLAASGWALAVSDSRASQAGFLAFVASPIFTLPLLRGCCLPLSFACIALAHRGRSTLALVAIVAAVSFFATDMTRVQYLGHGATVVACLLITVQKSRR